MRYDPSFEICAILFLIVIAAHFFSRPRYPSARNRFFTAFIIIGLIDIAADIASAYVIEAGASVLPWLNWFVNMLLYYCQITLAPLFFLYIVCITDALQKKNYCRILVAMLPYILTFILLTLNPLTGVYFYFDANGIYQHGDQFYFLYIGTAFYLVLAAGYVVYYRRLMRAAERNSILAFLAIVIGSIAMQYLFPQYLLTGVALSIAIVMLYLTFQNPDELLDALTGAFNRDSFLTYISKEIVDQRKFQIVLVDIDGMHTINSLFGVSVGDRALAAVGAYLRKMAGDGRTFRIVGDSFAIVTHSEKACMDLVHAIATRFEKTWLLDDLPIRMGARVCYSLESERCTGAADVISVLEHTLSHVRRRDGGSIMEISSNLQRSLQRSAYVEKRLRHALDTKALEVFFQPIYSLANERFSGMEALSRLREPDGTVIMPMEFIPIAERTGLIVRLGQLVIERTCAFLRDSGLMETEGFEGVSINLSPVECLDDTLVPKILSTVGAYGISPEKICFEITETAATLSDTLPLKMEELREKGFHFTLDDFGTGYANYDAIMRLPFSVVKLDKSLLDNVLVSEKAATVFSRSLDLINALGCRALVEGVETTEQAAFLRERNVKYVQGFLFAKPQEPEKLLEIFRCESA